MKLSWLSTSEAHKHTSMYMVCNMKQCSNKEREREFRGNGSNANNKICFEVRVPSSTSPPSPRRISNPLTCPPRTPTQGTSTEDLGQMQPGVPNSSLNQIQSLTEAMHSQTNHHLTQEGQAPSQTTTIHLFTKRDTNPNSTSHQREQTTISTSILEGANHNPNQPLPKRDTTNQGGYNKVVYFNHKQYSHK